MRMSEAIPKSIAPISAEDIKAAAITKTVTFRTCILLGIVNL